MSLFKKPFIAGDIVCMKRGKSCNDMVIDNFLKLPHQVTEVQYRGLFNKWNIYVEDAEGFGFHNEMLELVKR